MNPRRRRSVGPCAPQITPASGKITTGTWTTEALFYLNGLFSFFGWPYANPVSGQDYTVSSWVSAYNWLKASAACDVVINVDGVYYGTASLLANTDTLIIFEDVMVEGHTVSFTYPGGVTLTIRADPSLLPPPPF